MRLPTFFNSSRQRSVGTHATEVVPLPLRRPGALEFALLAGAVNVDGVSEVVHPLRSARRAIGPLCNLVKFQHRVQFGHGTLAKTLITFEGWSCCRSHPFTTFRPSIWEGALRTENTMSERGSAKPHVALGTFCVIRYYATNCSPHETAGIERKCNDPDKKRGIQIHPWWLMC